VTVDVAFRALIADLAGLREGLTDLDVTIHEDRPLTDDVALADRLADAAQDVAGWVEECARAAAAGRKEARRESRTGALGEALVACQEYFARASLRFTADLGSRDLMEALSAVGKERGGEWWGWADGVKQAVDRCQPLLHAVMTDLFACCREMGERTASTPVSLTAVAIGSIDGERAPTERRGHRQQRATVGGDWT
jgi:hypothetical protein